jgi:hypothetical protein
MKNSFVSFVFAFQYLFQVSGRLRGMNDIKRKKIAPLHIESYGLVLRYQKAYCIEWLA